MTTKHATDSMLAIETIGLTKHFGERVAVDAVNLMVPRGVVYGLLGHNGAGKSTLIRMLLGLTHRSAGQVRLLGRLMPGHRADALARVGSLVEEPKFHPHLTGRENLRVVADVRGLEVRARIAPALERVGLSNRADDRVTNYSLGMRQRHTQERSSGHGRGYDLGRVRAASGNHLLLVNRARDSLVRVVLLVPSGS
jgi:ABC-2 type transport system ATP-binding protein